MKTFTIKLCKTAIRLSNYGNPLPEAVGNSLDHLAKGELAGAAKAASADPALIQYLKQIVNSAAYGFKQELKDPMQIFSALGTQRARIRKLSALFHEEVGEVPKSGRWIGISLGLFRWRSAKRSARRKIFVSLHGFCIFFYSTSLAVLRCSMRVRMRSSRSIRSFRCLYWRDSKR